MEWSTSTMIGRSMGIDVTWGETSKFAIVITQYRNSVDDNSNTGPDNKSRLFVNISYAFNPEGRHNAKKEILIRF
jgi:hypothetical protein